MRSALKAACAAAIFLGGILSPASSGATELPSHPDLTIAVEGPDSETEIIAGYEVVYTVRIIDEGLVAAGLPPDTEITVVNTIINGVFVGGCDELKDGVCTKHVDGPVIPLGESSFQLVARPAPSDVEVTSTTPTFTTSITSEIKDDDLANTDQSDDKATAETIVKLNSTSTSACTYQGEPLIDATACRIGYFPPGTHHFGAHSVVVPWVKDDKTPGVLGELAEVGADSDFCRTHNCRYGIGVLENFYEVGEFKVTDRSNPLRTIINTPKGDPCRGLGAKPCSVLRYEDRPAAEWHQTQVPAPVIPFCTENDTIPKDLKPALCIDHREKTSSGGLRFEVLLLSSDPGMY